MKWEILNKTPISGVENLISTLLGNRGLITKKDRDEFLNPPDPFNIKLKTLDIIESEVDKAIKRIDEAKKNNELVFIYGDYDADGICSTAILWEVLHEMGINVLPFIPDRFEDGYGIKPAPIKNLKLKNKNLSLIITVDNGIVGYEGIAEAKKLGIDVIVIDHHTKGEKELGSLATIHSTQTSGAGLAWFFARELAKRTVLGQGQSLMVESLGLSAIGVVADQLPLIGVNRSIVKYGLEQLNKTKRLGIKALYEEADLTISGILKKPITTYEIGFIIAPRINAMGRLKHGIESLRLLCTKDRIKAGQIARLVASTNIERQKMVDTVLIQAMTVAAASKDKILVIAGQEYHEGIIGLAAGKLTEEFSRPSIVLSVKGELAKASARSVLGFDIISAIRAHSHLYTEAGGHPMAAGFSIETKNIEIFSSQINKYASQLLTDEILQKKLKIDSEITFEDINTELVDEIKKFEPFGMGNPAPLFATKGVQIINTKKVGAKGNHLKLRLKLGANEFDAIWFNADPTAYKLASSTSVSLAFQIEENVWNNHTSLQLKIKDLKL